MNSIFSSQIRTTIHRIVLVMFASYVLLNLPPKHLPPLLLDIVENIGLALLIVATLGRVWCTIYVGGWKNNTLVTEGPYSVSRNPLYLFSFIGGVGLGMVTKHLLLTGVFAVLFALYYPFVVREEEKYLASRFGAEYRDYIARTPRWIPNFRLFTVPKELTISPRHVHRGLLEAMWFLWFYLLWKMLEVVRLLLGNPENL